MLREMECRHAAGGDDGETGPGEERGVRYDGISYEHWKDDGRRAAEEVSSSESEEAQVGDMPTDNEEELWRRVERDGFPREETAEYWRREGYPGKRKLTQRQECGIHHHTQG